MSTQQDIYASGSENRPPMLNKDNYVPWSSRIIRYARSRPNGKMIFDSIKNGPYVKRMITTPEEPDLTVPVPKSFHEQTDDELTENDIKWMYAYDQTIQTILLGLPEDVYATVDSCEIAKEIWERVRQMMKGSDIEEQEKKVKLFNEWEKFTNKHFPENIAANLKFLDNLQPEWKRHVTIVRQTKNLHEANFTQIYEFLKMNQDEDRQIQNVEGNGGNQFGQYAGQVAQNQQGYNAWQNGGIQIAQNAVQNTGVQSGGNQNRLVVVPGIANQNGTGNVVTARAEGTRNGNQARCYNCSGLGHIARNCKARPRRRDASYLQTQLLIAQKEAAGIQLQAEEFDFIAAAGDLDEIEEVNANCILMANLQHASTSGVFVPQKTKSKEELFLSNVSNMATVSKTISIPNEHLSDDTTPSVAQKFLNEVKNFLVTLQRVVKQKMIFKVYNWLSSAHKEVHKIISQEIAHIINQVDARVQNFEIHFLQEVAKFVRDFKSLAKEADESLNKQNSLELKIKRLLKASVNHDIMSIVQNGFVDVPSDLRTELDRTKEKLELCIIKKEKEYAILWNNWYTKCEECKYDKISYDK
uniref:CCHC-type domain-containing protein n=1 Tax=Tanacetum cinerariifolium TaxID=118510 RepID=A0A699HA57_TANCI|nr:hypothetical protein [Tanacetum cinerariifolium]